LSARIKDGKKYFSKKCLLYGPWSAASEVQISASRFVPVVKQEGQPTLNADFLGIDLTLLERERERERVINERMRLFIYLPP
jgi:hypothetical protein